MRKNQLYYLIFPIIYFIFVTAGQYFANGNKWEKNLSLTVIALIVLCLSLAINNWAKTPHVWKRKDR
ncbi:hypothetical protein SSIL_1787 [Solibacillus silvestris StLB046]|uniref:Uncharacterized protein n=1 Tax=Solibacillus silvestris (strain StLB046) TaxID=1002809 RepID=F2FA75_SOLSS|nr:hypothetical protein [Solibacillus silvestris]BAK16210.1 hypothetical protein SSIL_1787 [Solibacillus silvestris StLB046]